MVRYFLSAGENAVEFHFSGESPRPGKFLVQGRSGGENFAPLAAAMRNDGPAGSGALTGTEAMLVLALTVTDSNPYFHLLTIVL